MQLSCPKKPKINKKQDLISQVLLYQLFSIKVSYSLCRGSS